jgi:periplasmic protein TonB
VLDLRMRLSLSVVIALLWHGAMFGVAAAVLDRVHKPPVAPVAVELDVIAAKPDPVVDMPIADDLAASTPAAVLWRPRFVRRAPRLAAAKEAAAAVTRSAAGDVAAEAGAVTMAAAPLAIPAAGSPGATPQVPARLALSAGSLLIAKPRYRTNPTPEYPIASRRRQEEGMVLLNVSVDAGGFPASVSLSRSSGFPLLDQAALEAVRRWTFEPARAAGMPVFSTVVVPVRFSLAEQP